MAFYLAILRESGFFFLAFFAGLLAFRYLNLFNRLILLQILLFLIVYTGGYAITTYQHYHSLALNNVWIYNFYFPIECAVLMTAGLIYLRSGKIIRIAAIAYLLFLLLFSWQLMTDSVHRLANFAVAGEALLLVTLYLFVLYQIIRVPSFSITRSPEVWASMGIVIYFACIVPYFSMMNYLNLHNMELSGQLFSFINNVVSNGRYLLTAIGYWLILRNKTSSILPAA